MEKAVHEHVMQPVHEMNFSEINLQEFISFDSIVAKSGAYSLT